MYKIYKVCDVEVIQIKDTAEGATGTKDAYIYQLADQWKEFISFPGVNQYFSINGEYLNWLGNSASAADGAAVAQLAHNYLKAYNEDKEEDQQIKPVNTVQVSKSVNLTADGYYLLVPSDGTTCGVVVVAGEPKTIKEKSSAPGHPTVTKKVLEDSTNTYGERNTADIGEKITFQTTITAGGNDSNFILHDDMDEHFLWLGGGNITRDGNLLNRGTDEKNPGDYYVVTETGDGCNFHVIFNDSLTKTLHEGATLVVNYYAVLTENTTFELDHANTTWLTYTAQNASSNKATTYTNTYKVAVSKIDQDGNPLAGAKFVLKDNVNKYYKWGEKTVGEGENAKTTTGVTWVTNINEATVVEAVKVTLEDNKVAYVAEFKGVDAENFTVVETVVPNGYTGAGEAPVSTKDNPDGGIATVTIKNVLGNALPETGGMGTTMFYVVGGLMAAAAVVLLITKKRVSAK